MDPVQVEWLIVADAAQVAGGKLYLLGGGWDLVQPAAPFPYDQRIAIALSLLVPWNETNRPHALKVAVEDEDGGVLHQLDGQVEVGRPAGLQLGQAQRMQVAIEGAIRLQRSGTYVVSVTIDGEAAGRTRFTVAPPGR